jgi:hypothetical protein
VTLNEWNHIAVVVDLASSSIRFFVNGTSAGETSYADTDFPDGGDAHMSFGAHIARDSAGDETRSRYYQGWLDEVRMWFAPLEASTIAANKNLSFVSWHPNGDALLAYYKFDQASGNVAYEYFHTAGYNAIIRSSDDSNVLWDITEIPSIEVPGSPAVMSPPPSPSPSPPPPPVPPPVSPPPPGRFQEQAGDAAVYFDGAGAFGVVAHSARLKDAVVNQALTVEAWIRPEEGEGFSRAQTIVALGELGWGVQLMCPEGAGLGCCGSHLDGALGFFADGNAASDVTLCERVMSSNASVPYGEWSHVAVVVDPRGQRRELAAHEIQHAPREVSASSSSGYGKRRLLSTESRGELESLIRRLARPTTRARGSGDAVSDTAPGASRSLLFFGGDTGGVTGAYGSADTVCPAWEKFAICAIFGSESAANCSDVQSEFGVACEFSSPYECSPANGGGDAYFEMIAKVESFDECHQLSTSMCETNSNCRVSHDDGSNEDYCELDFSVAASTQSRRARE